MPTKAIVEYNFDMNKDIKYMELIEKSKEYAKGKAFDAMTAAIEEAYSAGYKDGYDDGFAENRKIYVNQFKNGVEYVDFDLPHKTKWAKDFLRDENGKIMYLTYNEAEKFNIPSSTQYLELFNNTEGIEKGADDTGICRILGRNGYELDLKVDGICHGKYPVFWVSAPGSGNYKCYAKRGSIEQLFMGKKLPVLLVLPDDEQTI